jgi:tRNA (guanine37-N1)-methyltransferase
MRIDVVTVFPEYLDPLRLSLVGKARSAGLIELAIHDLRTWAHDRHRTVDDSPYGGGPGMVMRPEPWGEALDELTADVDSMPTLIVPSPSGYPMNQATAKRLAGRQRLIFACGRYEGIDQRVVDWSSGRMPVEEISLGDFIVNGGEVAAMAIIEAVVRLLPGFMGNPASLDEESYEAGLLEYPVYTKPLTWRGLSVPDVLVSGHHAKVAAWRREQSLARTKQRRPDLLADPPERAEGN